MSMQEQARLKAEQWACVLQDYAADVYAESGEAGAEAFWERLFELFVQEHDRFRETYREFLEKKSTRYEREFLALVERRDLFSAVEGYVFAVELPWRQALESLQKLCFRALVPEETALEVYVLLTILRCPPSDNPKLQAVRLFKDRGRRKLDDAIREVEELSRKYGVAIQEATDSPAASR